MYAHLKCQSRLDFLGQHFSDTPVEVRQNLHGQLWLDAPLADEVVECIGQRHADAAYVSRVEQGVMRAQYLLRR